MRVVLVCRAGVFASPLQDAESMSATADLDDDTDTRAGASNDGAGVPSAAVLQQQQWLQDRLARHSSFTSSQMSSSIQSTPQPSFEKAHAAVRSKGVANGPKAPVPSSPRRRFLGFF
jgi:hypothetical protein